METLVITAILPLLLTAVYLGFVLGMRYYTQSQSLARIQQEAITSMDWMVKELSAATVTACQASPGVLWFPSASAPGASGGGYSVDPVSGLLQWQKWVCYLPDSTGKQLLRSEVAFNTALPLSQIAAALPLPGLSLFQAASSQRVLSPDLESFTARVNLSSVQLSLVLSVNAGTAQVTRFQLDDEVHLINR